MGRQRSTRQSLRRIRTMTALLLIALVVSGCTSANGGGWLPSAAATDPIMIATNPTLIDAKANFGFNGKCEETQMEVDGQLQQVAALSGGDESQSGQFQYDDRAYPMKGVGVQFHGDVTGTGSEFLAFLPPFDTCEEVHAFGTGQLELPGTALLAGTYRPQDRTLAKSCGATRKGPNPCTFEAIVEDTGEPGSGFQNEFFNIRVTGGPFTGYQNQGPIQGGNIQVD